MANPSSQCISESEMGSESRPVMPVGLFEAAIKGNDNVLKQRLGLQREEQTDQGDHTEVTIEIGSVTHFGDTLLHLLVTQMHNDLALMVFKRDMSLIKARNKNSETPLHCAAKVGNVIIIEKLIKFVDPDRPDRDVVKDVVRETDNNGDTALHLAAKHGHEGVARELMKLDSGVAYMFNKEGLSPLYIATVGGYAPAAITILQEAPSLACEQYSNGMFPVHVAAGAGNIVLVIHFMNQYPDDAKLLDHCRRNLFHIAAEKNEVEVFRRVSFLPRWRYRSLINAKDYQGNTPLHIATIKGHTSVMIAISELLTRKEAAVQNNQWLTPFQLWSNQIRKTATKDMQRYIDSLSYIDSLNVYGDECFTEDLFDRVLKLDKNKWERIQVIGLGSVLITTVAFAAAFAIPGGYNQNNGTPVLGRKYFFKAFILANTQSFIQAFTSIFTLISTSSIALVEPDAADLHYATNSFNSAAGCMVLAFGLGSYVILAPVSLPIAIIVLSFTILGSPFITKLMQYCNLRRSVFGYGNTISLIIWVSGIIKRVLFQNMAFPLLFIFLLALA